VIGRTGPAQAPGRSHAATGPPRRERKKETLLRANPSKDGDAESRDYSEQASPSPPGRQRKEHGTLAAHFVV